MSDGLPLVRNAVFSRQGSPWHCWGVGRNSVGLLVAVALLAGCAASGKPVASATTGAAAVPIGATARTGASAGTTRNGSSSVATGRATAGAAFPQDKLAISQGCIGGRSDSGKGQIAWGQLRNPILSYPTRGIRDPSIRLVGGRWRLLFTAVTGNAPEWSLASSASADLRRWDAPNTWTQTGVIGLASPDVTLRPDGTYVATYQSDPGETSPPGEDKLWYRTSTDVVHWSAPHRLMPSLHSRPDERLIDSALAWTDRGVFLGYKFGLKDGTQYFEIAWSPSGSLDGPWTYVGRPNITVYGGTIENYEFQRIDGVWTVLATSNNLDRPWLFSLRGNPKDPKGWLDWSAGRELEVPAEQWNFAVGLNSVNYEQSNGAYLCDARRLDGHFYLFYFGTNELTTYGGWGHTSLGMARSTNLITWEVPCGPGRVSTPAGCA